eukprot:15474193-Alexandrium_andersonii.AAC.1
MPSWTSFWAARLAAASLGGNRLCTLLPARTAGFGPPSLLSGRSWMVRAPSMRDAARPWLPWRPGGVLSFGKT